MLRRVNGYIGSHKPILQAKRRMCVFTRNHHNEKTSPRGTVKERGLLMISTSQQTRRKSSLFCLCVLLFLVFTSVVQVSSVHGLWVKSPKKIQDLSGDFVIGGLFPVFVSEKNATRCHSQNRRYTPFTPVRGNAGSVSNCYRMNVYGLMWVEAMLFAINEINNSTKILRNYTLGYDIRDSANEVQFAMIDALDFSSKLNEEIYKEGEQNCSRSSVVAVIGGAGSKISKAAGYVLGVNSIPQISYSSTSPSLSNKANFPSFLRTIPPDYVQAQVMADLVSYFNWSYVSAVATDEDYGRLGIDAFKQETKARNVCISIDELFHPDYTLPETKEQIVRIVEKLKADKLSNVVVLFCEEPTALAFLEQAEKQGLTGKTWIGTDSWGDKKSILSFKDSTVGGMLGVVPCKGNIAHFEQHMGNLTPLNTGHNPWFADFWQGTYQCRNESINENNCTKTNATENQQNCSMFRVTCNGFQNGALPTASTLELNKAANVMDAVYSVALALDNMLNCVEGRGLLANRSCPSLEKARVHPADLLTYIKNLSFTGKLNFPVIFDKYGDIKGNYLIKSLQPDPDSTHGKKFTILGLWDWTTRKLEINNNTNISWNGWNPRVPFSRCSASCPAGHYKVQGDSKCCWKCVQCPFGSVTNTTGQTGCNTCLTGFTSSVNRTVCLQLPEVYLQWNTNVSIVILCFAGLGFLCTVFTASVFYRYRNSAVVKASTREYSLLILLMISCMFLLPLLHLGRPSDLVCKAQPFCFGFVVTFWTSLMLTKTKRLLLIFKHKGMPGQYNIFDVRLQLLIAILLTMVLIAPMIPWVIYFPPEVNYHYYDSRVSLDCGEKAGKLLMIILGYTAVLAIPSTYLAYRARHLPENFNETRLIGFTMFTVCVIWIVFVPCYYDSQVQNKSILLCFALITTGFTILVCMFSTRLRIIFFQPEKNKTEVVRANMLNYTMRVRNGSTAANNLRRTSVVTVGTFSMPHRGTF